jgi:hypothetical protein
MAFEPLRTDYTDAVWDGLKKYTQVDNDDGTVSFRDVTSYTNKEKSFFGSKDANRINEAANAIMAALESGTDLYTVFQNFFEEQKNLFEQTADETQDGLTAYVSDLEKLGDEIIQKVESDYSTEMDNYKDTQQKIFDVWFQTIRDTLSNDVATALANQIEENSETDFNRYYGLVSKTININKENDVVKNIVETGDGVTATTTFETISTGKKIVTVLVPDSESYVYTKTVLIENVDGGKQITESYKKEVK